MTNLESANPLLLWTNSDVLKEAQRLGAAFTKQLVEEMASVQPIQWPLLDTILIDWWYASIIELPRWEGEGGR